MSQADLPFNRETRDFKLTMILIYRLIYSLCLVLAFILGPLFSTKLRRYFSMRLKNRDFSKVPEGLNVILIHAASGEAEYAFPLIQRLKEQIHNAFVVCTYYSPSYEDKIKTHPDVDLAVPLPLDLPGPLSDLFERTHPKVILISRTDLWPEFLQQAGNKNIPVVLFSRTETPTSNPIKRGLKRWLYKKLHSVSVVSSEDQRAVLDILGHSRSPQVVIHGDTRWDQTFSKIWPLKQSRFLPHPFFVAGSVWEEDLEPLLKAWRPAYGTLVIAPHEIHEPQLVKLERRLEALNLRPHRYSQKGTRFSETPEGDVLIIDQIGVLYKSYLGAYGALIGGSFKKKVHSVMEALVCQTPVLVGPHYKNNREATQYSQILLPHDQLNASPTLKVVSVCETSSELQSSIQALRQRFLNLERTPQEYLQWSWAHPLCQETEKSPSQDVVKFIASIVQP